MLEVEPSFRRLVDHDGYPRLEDLGLLGDGTTTALVGLDGTSSSRPSNRSRNGTGSSAPVTSTVPSSSTMGSRRLAATIASPARVCAFSRISSSSRADDFLGRNSSIPVRVRVGSCARPQKTDQPPSTTRCCPVT